MKNVQQRLHRLEQLVQFQPPLGPLDLIKGRAIESLPTPELEVVWVLLLVRQRDARELSEDEAAACAAWQASIEVEAERMGFKCFAAADLESRASCALSNIFRRLEKIETRWNMGLVAESQKGLVYWGRILARWFEREDLAFRDGIPRTLIDRIVAQGDSESRLQNSEKH